MAPGWSDEEDSFFPHWFFYGYPKRKEPEWKRDEKLTKKEDKDKKLLTDKPEGTRVSADDLKGVLHVEKIDLNIEHNTKLHRTDKYECTEDRILDDGREEAAELVLRRGQPFRINVTFSRSFSLKKDDLFIITRTGQFPYLNSATHGRMLVDESGDTKFTADKWAANLVSNNGKEAVIDINVPSTCAIGEWSISVETETIENDKKKTFEFEHSDDIFIIFNPWCKDDQTYMKDEKALKEYVLNDHACVYRGNQYNPKAKPWYLGQFEAEILDTCMFIIRKCFRAKQRYKLCDPVIVARTIAQVVNCCDSDNGILWGNWSGNYEDGQSPSTWSGSVKIIRQYAKTGQPVKYGQCWVFSGVATTVCRAVGIPARSVTNFASAHDTDNSSTIDCYYKVGEDGNLEPAGSGDSVWNFHVWNDVWMARPDIPCKNNEFDGWQAIDATPQEKSNGVFTCGPCPLYAIKNGLVTKPYDAPFVFSEVNADYIYWKPAAGGGYTKFKVKRDKVGKCMSTKKPDGKAFDAGAWFASRQREDVTNDYKYPENSEDNRRAVLKAALGVGDPTEAYSKVSEDQDVVFKLLHNAELHLGQDVEVKLTAKNNSTSHSRKVKAVTFNFQRQKYTGEIMRLIKSDKLKDEIKLRPGEQHEFTSMIKHSDYVGNLEEENCMCIQAFAMVKKSRSRPEESCVKSHDVEFVDPNLQIKMPETVKKGDEFEAVVTFDNPLSEELTDCVVEYESGGIPNKDNIKQDNVSAMGKFREKFILKAKRKGDFTVTFKFTSKQLRNVTGSVGFTAV